MAKKNDHLADFETENTGGVLTGFLAEEEHLDRRGMLRLGTWGAASVGAIIVAVLANQSSLRLRRDELAAADLTRQAQQIQSVARESQTETRRLASAIDTLNSDRDRMYTRLSTLEQGLDSVTGAIAKQNAVAATAAAVPAPAASTNPASSTAAV
jgi:signal transduction histidine kinase